MNEIIFQKIFDEVDGFLPEKWNKLILYLEYMEGAYSFSFYLKLGEAYVKCYDLPDIEEDAIMSAFSRIDKFVDKERKVSSESWTNMTMIVTSDGEMHADFDYTDLSEGSYKYKKDWKAKYLI